MKEFDRAMIAWSKGNKRGKLGTFWFTPTCVFENGQPLCVRFRDVGERPLVLVRLAADFGAERLFKGRRWAYATPGEFSSVPSNFLVIEDLQARARERWQRIPISELKLLGDTLMSLCEYSERHSLDLTVTDLRHEDRTILGARFLLQGRADAICEITDGWKTWETSYKLFETFDEAVLFKMKNNGVKLHDLT